MLENIIDSIGFRALFAFFTALILGLSFGSRFITFAKQHQGKGQPIREDGPKSHLETKKGTPTMGGLLIIGSSLVSILLWCSLTNAFVLSALFIYLIYGLIGFADDYIKVSKNSSLAITGPHRLMMEFGASILAIGLISYATAAETRFALDIPYFQNLALNLCWFYIPFAMFVIVGTANSVNLSDGLDGLAGGLCTIAFFAFMLIAYACGTDFSAYVNVTPIAGSGEIAVLCAAVIGGCISFLWFNAPPAKIFMGDTGSLALGGLLGTVAVITKHEIVLAIIGGIFVIETLSVILQVTSFKLTGKRIFKMSPIHHHFELCGHSELRIVKEFTAVSFILSALAVMLNFML